MIVLRSLLWPNDREKLLSLDTSFITDRIYRLEQGDHTFTLREEQVAPAVSKTYRLENEIDMLPSMDWVVVADDDQLIAGFAAMSVEKWNRRANLQHLYVAPDVRGKGFGRMMIDAAIAEAGRMQARCLWVETQTVNYGAVQFYLRMGFKLCGFDSSLYDPKDVADKEIALFLSRDLA